MHNWKSAWLRGEAHFFAVLPYGNAGRLLSECDEKLCAIAEPFGIGYCPRESEGKC
jgi:hypothetical protein